MVWGRIHIHWKVFAVALSLEGLMHWKEYQLNVRFFVLKPLECLLLLSVYRQHGRYKL